MTTKIAKKMTTMAIAIFSMMFIATNLSATEDDIGEPGDDNGVTHVICYHESRVSAGSTYYDCGSCRKEYDERGRGRPSKCWPSKR